MSDDIFGIIVLIVLSVAWIGVMAFFSLWIHRAEGNRALTMGLYLVFGGVAWFGFLFGAGTAWRASREGEAVGQQSYLWIAIGLAAGIALIPQTRRILARIMPFDANSKPDMIGLTLLLSILAFSIVSLFFDTELTESPGYLDVAVQAILLTSLALFGVGLFVVRSLPETLRRLGLVRPTVPQVAIALGLVLVAFAISITSSILVEVFQPELSDSIQDNLDLTTRQLESVWGAIFLGMAAGISEESLFRGAFQPRFGVLFTSLVFALLHTQYGPSFVIVGVFGVALLFALERKYLNTTCAVITHATYNALAVMLSAWAGFIPFL